MGDARHKKPPPPDAEEDVTDAFRKEVRDALDLNARQNKLRRLRKGDPGYVISNRAELAEAIGTDKTMVNKIIGGAREGTKVKLVERSAYVGRIRAVLHLAAITKIAVSTDRADILRFIAELPDDEFKLYQADVRRRARKNGPA